MYFRVLDRIQINPWFVHAPNALITFLFGLCNLTHFKIQFGNS